jgi:hypothetical protein
VGCSTSDPVSKSGESSSVFKIPKWSFWGKIGINFLEGQKVVPKNAYVFPALRMDSQGRLIDQLSHRLGEDGKLVWYSQAPKGGELKRVVEDKLESLGFTIVSFDEMTASQQDRSVFVLNLYYRPAAASSDSASSDSGSNWTTYARITGATFDRELNPSSRVEVMNQEMVTLFDRKELDHSVIKRSFDYLLDYVGINRQWSELIYLL